MEEIKRDTAPEEPDGKAPEKADGTAPEEAPLDGKALEEAAGGLVYPEFLRGFFP